MNKPFSSVAVRPPKEPPVKRRYSVTQDIVGFRRCPRQYGEFNVHNYAPAQQTQLYFGTILHQVLDRCHQHYHGDVDPQTKGKLPDDGRVLKDTEISDYFIELRDARGSGGPPPPPPTELLSYFIEVEEGLKSQGIRAITRDLRVKAVRILQYFNHLEGPTLYPRVRDTEHRLQADQQTHILHGVVDLLLSNMNSPDDPDDCEIWDYKGTSRVHLCPSDLETYMFQMRVYAHLYRLKHGVLPRRVVLYFMSELEGRNCPTKRPVNATLEFTVDSGLSQAEISAAVEEFDSTVLKIEDCRNRDEWKAAPVGGISEQDCAICDLRWDCSTPNHGKGVKMVYP